MEERDYGETPMTNAEKLKKQCSSSVDCFWDKLVESFKLRGKGQEGTYSEKHCWYIYFLYLPNFYCISTIFMAYPTNL